MKKKLVTYLLISALAVTVFAGCGKKDDGGDAAAADAPAADAVETVVTEDAPEGTEDAPEGTEEDIVEAVEETVEADAVEATTAIDAAAAEAVEAADTAVAAVAEEYTDETEAEAAEAADAAVTGEVAASETENVVPANGTQYTVRFGGNVYSSPEANDANIQYFANPGDTLNIVERVDNSSWYKVTYWLAGEGIEHEGYIEIE